MARATYAYNFIYIIYNPKSTGDAEKLARRFYKRLKRVSKIPASLIATEHQGHAKELAYTAAKKHREPLIISVSGDGSYNEVINGAMQACTEDPKARPVCAIMPAGNANDHRRSTRRKPLLLAIRRDQPTEMDVLRLQVTDQKTKKETVHYAHSYIGFGITATIRRDLDRIAPSRFGELGVVLRGMFNSHYVRIVEQSGLIKRYDSIILANIHQMAKVFRMGEKTRINDGKLRLVTIEHRPRWRFFITTLRILIFGFRKPPLVSEYSFQLTQSYPVQLDGEVQQLAGGSLVHVSVVSDHLRTIR